VRKAVSRLYGKLQSASWSRGKIDGFVRRFSVAMDECEPGPFASFNDFFIRKFRTGLRPFPENPHEMGAFAEARYLAYAIADQPLTVPIKGLRLDPLSVLGNTPGKERFRGGPVLLARLCPVDYHRFHFPDDGEIKHFHEEGGKLHSVNPAALVRKPDLFLANERHISLLETRHFGTLAYVEVGALCVGRIVQTGAGPKFSRGQEKGYFLFGGSTVILYGELGAWVPAEDLLRHTSEGYETLVQLGDAVAQASPRG
jgi:phosphatidylserine decarboxylase